jgi:ABC-type bacteriocin/lantibiotic exporter with double-glycine peptidase domain
MNCTRGVIILVILFYQSGAVFIFNLIYILFFLGLSLSISKKFAPYAEKNSRERADQTALITHMVMTLNVIRRLGIQRFFTQKLNAKICDSWEALNNVQQFHARRWFIQLNLFNFLYILTLSYSLYQIKVGVLEIGFLVLLKWSFDQLWSILVYIIEYYVTIIQQIEDAKILREELGVLEKGAEEKIAQREDENLTYNNWQKISYDNVEISFIKNYHRKNVEASENGVKQIIVPELAIHKGDKIALLGESGSGKTTIINVLLNLINYTGNCYLHCEDERFNFRDIRLPLSFFNPINASDPLFKFSVDDNILLGRQCDSDRIKYILEGLRITSWLGQPEEGALRQKIGSEHFYLSSGQEQRIRLARGLIHKSEVYILDEAFNGIDDENKEGIIDFLREELKDSTVILITHNVKELRLVDKVYRLEEGRLIS